MSSIDPSTIDAALIARLRRLVAEPSSATYDDAALRQLLADAVVTDMATVGRGGGLGGVVDARHIPQPAQFDLHAAAAIVWEEKVADLIAAGTFDLSADGESFSLSQKVIQYQQRLAYHLARRRVRSVRQIMRRAPGAVETINADIDKL